MSANEELSLARDIDQRCRLRGTFTLRSGQMLAAAGIAVRSAMTRDLLDSVAQGG